MRHLTFGNSPYLAPESITLSNDVQKIVNDLEMSSNSPAQNHDGETIKTCVSTPQKTDTENCLENERNPNDGNDSISPPTFNAVATDQSSPPERLDTEVQKCFLKLNFVLFFF